MIKALELREVMLRFLELQAHPTLLSIWGVDMDHIQSKVYKELPPFNFTNGVIVCFVSAVYWQIQLMLLHRVVQFTLRAFRTCFPSNDNVLTLPKRDQLKYTSYVHSSIHALFAIIGALYGLIYSDGQFGTTWFHCNFYKLNMFDIQKYFSMVSIGWYIQDFLFCLSSAETNSTNQL